MAVVRMRKALHTWWCESHGKGRLSICGAAGVPHWTRYVIDVVSVDVFGYSISAQTVCPAVLRSGIRSSLRDEGTTAWSGWHEEACPSQDFQSGGKCRYAYPGNRESQYVACGVTVLRSSGRWKLVFSIASHDYDIIIFVQPLAVLSSFSLYLILLKRSCSADWAVSLTVLSTLNTWKRMKLVLKWWGLFYKTRELTCCWTLWLFEKTSFLKIVHYYNPL